MMQIYMNTKNGSDSLHVATLTCCIGTLLGGYWGAERFKSCTDMLIVRARLSCIVCGSSLPKRLSNGLLMVCPADVLLKSTDKLPDRLRWPEELDHVDE